MTGMLLRTLMVILLAGVALCLDLEAVQRTTHFPQHKRGDDSSAASQRDRLLSELVSRRMARLLPALLREQDDEEGPPPSARRHGPLPPASQRTTSGRVAPGSTRWGALVNKRVARKKEAATLSGRAEKKAKQTTNRRVPRLLEANVRAMRRPSTVGSHHQRRGALIKRDAKVLGELRQIFSEEQEEKPEKKTLRKREDVADLANVSAGEGKKNESDEEKFKKWLLDEYYRTMALSFASMRKKRMASTWQLPLPSSEGPAEPGQGVDDGRFQAAEDRLRALEESLLSEALALESGDAGGPTEGRVAARLDAAYDLESVRRALDHLHNALSIIQMQDEQEDSGPARSSRTEAPTSQCRVLQVLTSGCSALEGYLPLDPAFKSRLMTACNWHEVCYTCGALYGLSSDDCDEGFADGDSTGQVLDVLRQRRAFVKRSASAACSAPCVQEFLGNP